MAVRRVYHINSTYRDTVRPNRSISKKYRDALLAVYNATALPVRDTIVKMLNIHTDLNPEVNVLNVKATSTLSWMQELNSNNTPTSNAVIKNIMDAYAMQFTYYQSTQYDMVVFKADSNINLKALAKIFMNEPGVISATPEQGFNDVKNITDSIHSSYLELIYSVGWGTCADTCDHRRFWRLKVFSDCSVQYGGASGDTLFSAIKEIAFAGIPVAIYPNPAADVLNVQFRSSYLHEGFIEIFDLLGRRVLGPQKLLQENLVDLYGINAGLYYLRVSSGKETRTFKVLKE
jgi:hypothetical protein